jgi:plasmid maintenance system antidote protein VapI
MKNVKEIEPNDIWNEGKKNDLKKLILSHSRKQSNERRLRNELLSIQYQIEDYIENDSNSARMDILDFIKMYLKTLNVTQKKLASLFEMRDSNLHKYLVGERKLNTHIVLKLSSFSHTSPEYWLRIQVKNELMEITKEKGNAKKYRKYDYRNLLVGSEDR